MRWRRRGSRKSSLNRSTGQGLGFQRLQPMGVHVQRSQEGADLGWDEPAGRQQGMDRPRLADVVGQQAARVKLAVTRSRP